MSGECDCYEASTNRARQAQREAAADTYLLTEARYRNGIESFLGSLDSQRSYYSAQRTPVLSQRQAGTNLVDLYRSLGGDSSLTGPLTTTAGP